MKSRVRTGEKGREEAMQRVRKRNRGKELLGRPGERRQDRKMLEKGDGGSPPPHEQTHPPSSGHLSGRQASSVTEDHMDLEQQLRLSPFKMPMLHIPSVKRASGHRRQAQSPRLISCVQHMRRRAADMRRAVTASLCSPGARQTVGKRAGGIFPTPDSS